MWFLLVGEGYGVIDGFLIIVFYYLFFYYCGVVFLVVLMGMDLLVVGCFLLVSLMIFMVGFIVMSVVEFVSLLRN